MTDMSIIEKEKLDQVKRIAKKKRIEFIKLIPSPRKDKKYRIYISHLSTLSQVPSKTSFREILIPEMLTKKEKYIDFGSRFNEDFLDHHDEQRRIRFHQRFQNNKGYNNPLSGLYYSSRLLW